jgi:hypothetical protein
MWNNKVLNSTNIFVDPIFDKIRFMGCMIVVEKHNITIIEMLRDIRHQIFLEEIGVCLLIQSFNYTERPQAMK